MCCFLVVNIYRQEYLMEIAKLIVLYISNGLLNITWDNYIYYVVLK